MDFKDLMSERELEDFFDRQMAEAEFYEECKKEEEQLRYLEEKESK